MLQTIVFSGPERRRWWRDEWRLQILADAFAPGAKVADAYHSYGFPPPWSRLGEAICLIQRIAGSRRPRHAADAGVFRSDDGHRRGGGRQGRASSGYHRFARRYAAERPRRDTPALMDMQKACSWWGLWKGTLLPPQL